MKYPVDIKYITLAQIIGCFLVILGHSYPFVTPVPDSVISCRTFLYTFHMPLFVWCSGYLFAHTRQSERKTIKLYTIQRTVKLLIPYLILSLAGLVPKVMASSFLNDKMSLDAFSLLQSFFAPRYSVWGHFWFLPMIYIICVVGFVIDLLPKKNLAWTIALMVGLVGSFFQKTYLEWFSINDVLKFFMFYAMGVLCSRFQLIQYVIPKARYLIIICLAASLTLFLYIGGSEWCIHLRNTFIAIMMISAIVLLSKKIENISKVNRNSLIAQTYQIFIMSWPCQLVVGIVVERILHWNWMIFMPIVFCIGICGPMMLLTCIDWFEDKTKTKYISFVLGR